MSNTLIDRHVAESKMKLKSSNHCLSFVSTLWKGEVILCTFNNINRTIADIFCAQHIEYEDKKELEYIIDRFVSRD
jgi:hypothetical protein